MMERELPEGWKWKRLEEIADINSRFDKNSFNDETEVTFLPMRCVEELTGRMDTSIERKYGEIKTGYTPIQEGDLLFAKITPCIENGKIAIAQNLKNGIGFASTEFHTLKFSPNCETKFYFFFLMQEKIRQEAARNMTGTAGQQRVPVTFLKRLKVPVPPLAIQRQIVALLERVEAVKRQRKEADALTGALLQSVFYEMFGDPVRNERGWDVAKFDEICDEICVGIVVRPASYYVESGVPAFRSLNIRADKLNLENFVYIKSSDNETVLSKSKIRRGDVLVVRTGYPGTACVVPPEFEGANCIDLIILRPKKQIVNSDYMSRFLNSEYGKAQALAGNTGLAQQHLNVGAIRQVKIPLPPLALQQQFAHIVAGVEYLRERQKTSAQEINVLNEVLMQRAFGGERVA
jgi:type I restriction enzyme S subunit